MGNMDYYVKFHLYFYINITRGGVEDTRLEAKAKDTKKILGQGQCQRQPFQGQTLSRPRTGKLEAKDQRHSQSCSQKKKRSSKNFFRQSPIYRRGQNFWLRGGTQTTNHMQWRHQKFSKDELFVGQIYHRRDDLKLLPVGTWPGFCRGRELKVIVKKYKYLTLETCWGSLCKSNLSQTGVWGQSPQP